MTKVRSTFFFGFDSAPLRESLRALSLIAYKLSWISWNEYTLKNKGEGGENSQRNAITLFGWKAIFHF